MTDADRQRTAYHESGLALVGMLTPAADPVRKVSIIPRGQALGVTLATPESDRYSYRQANGELKPPRPPPTWRRCGLPSAGEQPGRPREAACPD
jgi:hypothetical protein